MTNKENLFAEELHRTLHWLSRNDGDWRKINGLYGCESTIKEISDVIDRLTEEKLYIPLMMFLINDFLTLENSRLMLRILTDILISQWNDNTWEIVTNAIKKTIVEYSEEKGAIRPE